MPSLTTFEKRCAESVGLLTLKRKTHFNESPRIFIAKILRELDDKSESLREAAAEISNLRGRVKLLQN